MGTTTRQFGEGRVELEAAWIEERQEVFGELIAAAYERMDGREYGERSGTVGGYRDGRAIGGHLVLVRTGDTINLTFRDRINNEDYQLIVPADGSDGIAATNQHDVPLDVLRDITQLLPDLK